MTHRSRMPALPTHMDLEIVDQAGGDFRHASILLYGKDLSGKTTTAAAAGRYQAGLIISVEDGTRGITGRVAHARTPTAIDQAVAHALAGGYQAVTFDTLDKAYAIGLDAASRGELAVLPNRGAPIARRGGQVDDNRVKDPRFLHLITMDWLIGHVRSLHAAPLLALFTAHAREVEDKDKQGAVRRAEIRLDLSPRFASLVRDTMDMVFYLYRTGKGERMFFADTVIAGDPPRTFYAKDRTGRFAGPDGRYVAQPLSFEHIAHRLGLTLTERTSEIEQAPTGMEESLRRAA